AKQIAKFLHRNLRNVIEFITAGDPTYYAVLEVCLHVLNSNARQAQLRLAKMVSVFSDENDAFVETQNPRSPGCILPGETDVNGPGNMRDCELHRRSRVQHNCAFGL